MAGIVKMRDNKVRAALKRGETVIGTVAQDVRSPAIAQLFANAGFDFMFVDMEHGAYDLETVADIVKVARLADIVPLVRVPDGLYHLIARVLDAGAMGVMVPRVETRRTVERAVAALRYPPRRCARLHYQQGQQRLPTRPAVGVHPPRQRQHPGGDADP